MIRKTVTTPTCTATGAGVPAVVEPGGPPRSALSEYRPGRFLYQSLLLLIKKPNDPSSATRPTRASDCNRSAMAGFAAAHG